MNTKKYQYILFDWDGCLAKTLDIWLKAYRIAYGEYGVHPTDQEIAHHFGDWEAPKYYGITDIEGCFNKIDAIASKDLKKVDLYEGAKQVLDNLKMAKNLALLSSSPREIIKAALEHNQLTDYFLVVLAGEDVTHHKPHPEIIEKGLELLKGDKNQSVMIGDSRKDLEAANNAGVDSVLFYPPSHTLFYKFDELKAYKPTFTINNFEKLLQIIK